MLRFLDLSDFCSLTEGEIETIAKEANVTLTEAIAFIHEQADKQEGCREVLRLMQQHLERIESKKDGKGSRRIHEAINNFAKNHKFV